MFEIGILDIKCETGISVLLTIGVVKSFSDFETFHALIPTAWLADDDCQDVRMGRQIAKMFSTFSL